MKVLLLHFGIRLSRLSAAFVDVVVEAGCFDFEVPVIVG